MKKWIPQTGWLLALGLAIICLVLIFEVSNRIHLESLLRADPAQLDKHRDRSEIPTERPLLLLTGDSRARDLGSTKIGEYHVENRGIPGQTTAEILARVGRDMAILKPDEVVVIAGINDLKIGSAAGRGPVQAATALGEILAIGEAMDIPITLLEVWGATENFTLRGLPLPQSLPGDILALNSRIIEMGALGSAKTASANAILNNENLVRAELARDTFHLNDQGLEILRKLISESLDATSTDTD